MKRTGYRAGQKTTTAGLLLLVLLLSLLGGCEKGGSRMALGGGPRGGTFQTVATGLAELINREMPEVRVRVERTGGSVANLTSVDRGKMPMALVFAGDAYLASEGLLHRGQPAAENVRALARLYGAAAQLVVPKDSPIQTPHDLKRRRIAIGSPGSGAALSARRFFRSLGIWEEIIPIYVGYALGMEELSRRSVEAVWFEGGFPSVYLQEVSRKTPIRLIALFDAAVVSGFFQAFPFYAVARVPAGTYHGQEEDVLTFQDAAVWVANAQVDEDFVYRALKLLFSEQGLAKMRSVHPVGSDLDMEKGLMGVKFPLHSGAERFWREMEGRVL